MRPDEALKILAVFEGKLARLKEERDNLAKAKEALELAEPGQLYFFVIIQMAVFILQFFFQSRSCSFDSVSSRLNAEKNLFAGHVSASEERVMVSQEELQDLKGVWAELSKIWQQIDELKERPWMSVQPRKVLCVSVGLVMVVFNVKVVEM